MKSSVKVGSVIVVIIAVIATIAFMGRKESSSQTPQKNDSSQSTATPTESSSEVAATITYSDNGFSSSVDNVKSGATVKVVNQSKRQLSFASDPHPVHTDDPELNAGTISPGDSKSFIVKTKGTWGFHNHLHEQDEGSITVE